MTWIVSVLEEVTPMFMEAVFQYVENYATGREMRKNETQWWRRILSEVRFIVARERTRAPRIRQNDGHVITLPFLTRIWSLRSARFLSLGVQADRQTPEKTIAGWFTMFSPPFFSYSFSNFALVLCVFCNFDWTLQADLQCFPHTLFSLICTVLMCVF